MYVDTNSIVHLDGAPVIILQISHRPSRCNKTSNFRMQKFFLSFQRIYFSNETRELISRIAHKMIRFKVECRDSEIFIFFFFNKDTRRGRRPTRERCGHGRERGRFERLELYTILSVSASGTVKVYLGVKVVLPHGASVGTRLLSGSLWTNQDRAGFLRAFLVDS